MSFVSRLLEKVQRVHPPEPPRRADPAEAPDVAAIIHELLREGELETSDRAARGRSRRGARRPRISRRTGRRRGQPRRER